MTPMTYRAAGFLAGAAAAGVEIVVGTNRAQTLAGLAPAHNLTLPFDDREEAIRRAREYAAAPPITAVVGVDDEGVLITGVRDGSPAEEAGLKRGDRILELDGQPVETTRDLRRVMRGLEPEDNRADLQKQFLVPERNAAPEGIHHAPTPIVLPA